MLKTIFRYLWIAFLLIADIIWLSYIIWLKVKYYAHWVDWLEDEDVTGWLRINIGGMILASFISFYLYS